MSLNRSQILSESQGQIRNASWISMLTLLIAVGVALFAVSSGNSSELWSSLPVLMAAFIAYWFSRTDRHILGSAILMGAIGLQSIFAPLIQRGLGVPTAIASLAVIGGMGLATLPRKYIGRVLMIGLAVSAASLLLDLFGSLNRPVAGSMEVRWAFSFIALAIFGIFFARDFLSLDIRTKIVLGILGTGGIALFVLVFFALDQTQRITSRLSERLDTSVSQLAEEQLINAAFTQTNLANQTFEDVMEEVSALAQNWSSLESQKEALNKGTYWDARTSLVQLAGGQYGNSPSQASSVFVPKNSQLDESLINDLNTSAYLDFYAPGVLATHPALLAVYAIDARGVTRYYPNINLASILLQILMPRKDPILKYHHLYFNPQRLPRRSIPYVDATGGGLVVTAVAPVYQGNKFNGVVAADMKLADITGEISAIKIGQTGYAFMIDDAGRILSMPPAGFDMFGIRSQEMNNDDFSKQTILGSGSQELQATTRRMVAGGKGLLIANVDGVDTYLSFSPIKANGYSVALVVPVSELQGAILTARQETGLQIRSASRVAALLLIVLMMVAVAVSLGLGQIIASPVQRLTQVASQIASGHLNVQAAATTSDEIGTLAESFNIMTARLRETLDGLEQRVEERTEELLFANEKNERRARQFETIAHIARTISSTRDIESLLTQITTLINREFGFYHVGIFLLDTAKEYAVLSAANSEGGRTMLERGHQLKVGETGMVGYATSTGKPRVALDTGADPAFFNNPYLPETRSEIVLPLRVSEEIIGALDVQSVEQNAFSQEDINILSILADQVSIAIQNAQQFEQTRKALNESEALARQFVRIGWQQFTKSKNLVGIRHTSAKATLLYGKNGNRQEEIRTDIFQAETKYRGASLSMPVTLRGEVIGSVDVHAPDTREWDQDELDIVTAIIERAAIAMENARLLADSQKRAAKERTIGEISTKIGSQSEIDELIKTAARELSRAMPDAEVAIQFQRKEQT